MYINISLFLYFYELKNLYKNANTIFTNVFIFILWWRQNKKNIYIEHKTQQQWSNNNSFLLTKKNQIISERFLFYIFFFFYFVKKGIKRNKRIRVLTCIYVRKEFIYCSVVVLLCCVTLGGKKS